MGLQYFHQEGDAKVARAVQHGRWVFRVGRFSSLFRLGRYIFGCIPLNDSFFTACGGFAFAGSTRCSGMDALMCV